MLIELSCFRVYSWLSAAYYTPTALALHQSTLGWSTLGQLTQRHRETWAAVHAVGDWKHLCVCRGCSIGRHRLDTRLVTSAKDPSAFKWLKFPYFPLKCLKSISRDIK